jgi:hypothetical protein
MAKSKKKTELNSVFYVVRMTASRRRIPSEGVMGRRCSPSRDLLRGRNRSDISLIYYVRLRSPASR